MSSFTRLAEWYFGLEPAAESSGVRWSARASNPLEGWLSVEATIVLAVLATALLVRSLLREAPHAGVRSRVLLGSLRVVALTMVALFLSGLTLSIERTGRPLLAVLVDDSLSMSLDDHYGNDGAQAFIRSMSQDGAAPPSRSDIALRLLNESSPSFAALAETHDVRFFRFGANLEPLDGDPPFASTVFSAKDEATRPAAAIRELLAESGGKPIAAVVLLTDGACTDGGSELLRIASGTGGARRVPIFPVGIGSRLPGRDIELRDAEGPELAFVDDPVTVSVGLTSFGFEGESAQLELTRDGELLMTEDVVLVADGQTERVELTFTPRQEGEYRLSASMPVREGETDAENNRVELRLLVRRAKLSVLLVDRVPRYEFRYLKTFLEREPTVDLHTLLLSSDSRFAAQDDSARALGGRFPVGEDGLASYDVIIWGDVPPTETPPTVLEALAEAIIEDGKGLVLIPGTSFTPNAFLGTPLEPLLPFRVEAAEEPQPIRKPFAPRLTPQAERTTRLFRFADSVGESRDLFEDLPRLRSATAFEGWKPNVVPLLVHPDLQTDGKPLPIIVRRSTGAGVIVFHATDDLWIWRLRRGGTVYARYWGQLLRSLVGRTGLSDHDAGSLATDRERYEVGDVVHFLLAVAPAQTAEVSVRITADDGRVRTEPLARSDDAVGLTGRAANLPAGRYRAVTVLPDGRAVDSDVRFDILDRSPELAEKRLDQETLEAASRASGGEYLPLYEFARLADVLPTPRPVLTAAPEQIALWNRWELLLLFGAALGGGWFLRKRLRLL